MGNIIGSFKNLFRKRGDLSAMLTGNNYPKSIASEKMKESLALWERMYTNRAEWLTGDVKSLNLAAAVSSELARLVTMEMKVRFDDEEKFRPVKKGFDRLLPDIRRFTEYACAKGAVVFKPYVSGGEIYVDCVQADCFFPTECNARGEITGAVFVQKIHRNGFVYTRLEKHGFENGLYVIENEFYRSKNEATLGVKISADEVSEWSDLCERAEIENVKRPLFAYFKMPSANTVDTSSPFGVSVFARATELIEDADRQYSRLLWEFESGERALYMDSAAYRRDEKGNPVFPDKRLYRSADTGIDGLFEDWTPTLREQSILNGLDAILVRIEDACSVARGTFSSVHTGAKTATELKMLRQRSYSAVADIQNSLANSLRSLVYAMCVWASLYGLCEFGECGISFEFDDSIIADREREFDERERLVNLGAIKPYELRAWYLGESEDVAREMCGA